MILACFPHALSFTCQDGPGFELLPYSPVIGEVLDTSRVYLLLEETYHSIRQACGRHGLTGPVQLTPELMAALPHAPQDVQQSWSRPAGWAAGQRLRVCLLNGGAGGLGDGIMFAPALRIMAASLAAHSRADALALDAYSALPERTAAGLGGIDGLRVRPLPLTLHDFGDYDLYVDFSGMLTNASFHTSHMTDFCLAVMGLDPSTITEQAKEPRLVPPPPAVELLAALAFARRQAAGRPLVAVIFTATKTRSMPDELAASLMRELAPRWAPVVILPPGLDGKAFIAQHGLTDGEVIDLSPASRDFGCYLNLLNGMDAVLSVDTSAVHVGAGLGKATVGIFNSIDHRLRVRYSPTVVPIQLAYQGRKCQAPCSISKSRFHFSRTLADATPIRWDFGYACPESFDEAAMTDWLNTELDRLPAGTTPQELEAIRQQASHRFTRDPAPCWQALRLSTVVEALSTALSTTAH